MGLCSVLTKADAFFTPPTKERLLPPSVRPAVYNRSHYIMKINRSQAVISFKIPAPESSRPTGRIHTVRVIQQACALPKKPMLLYLIFLEKPKRFPTF